MAIADKDMSMQFDTHAPGEAWHNISGRYTDITDSENIQVADQSIEELVAPVPTERSAPIFKKTFTPTDTNVIDPKKPTILIIDDSDEIRAIYAELFTREGYNVEEAHDGLSGLDRIKKFQPDVVWTGISMPRMDGYTLIETLKKNPALAEIPVFICSHEGDMKDHARMQSLGVADFILHGYVSPEEVIDRVAAHLTIRDEYLIPLDPYDTQAQQLVVAHAADITCPEGQNLSLKITHEKGNCLSAQFICADK